MTSKTNGIVLRQVKYGETSLIVTILTFLYGVQSYIVNGVRTSGKKGMKAVLYQPASLLQMEVYHNDKKNLQRIKEAEWSYVYKNVFSDVIKNCIALFMMELLDKLLRQPEQNANLFYFAEDTLHQLDKATAAEAANFPLFFTLQLPQFFGFSISEASPQLLAKPNLVLDLEEGSFTDKEISHANFLNTKNAFYITELLQIRQPNELSQIKLNRQTRQELMCGLMLYYSFHIPDFKQMKTLQVMNNIMS